MSSNAQTQLNTLTSTFSNYLTTTSAASTYLSQSNATSTYAKILSPDLSGSPTAPTVGYSVNSNVIATTAFVQSVIAHFATTTLTAFAPLSYVASTYLAIADATSTYLTIANAASTYLTIANATSAYAPKSSPVLTNTSTDILTVSGNNYQSFPNGTWGTLIANNWGGSGESCFLNNYNNGYKFYSRNNNGTPNNYLRLMLIKILALQEIYMVELYMQVQPFKLQTICIVLHYIHLVVLATPYLTCPDPSLNHYVFMDNNGIYTTGCNSVITGGSMNFTSGAVLKLNGTDITTMLGASLSAANTWSSSNTFNGIVNLAGSATINNVAVQYCTVGVYMIDNALHWYPLLTSFSNPSVSSVGSTFTSNGLSIYYTTCDNTGHDVMGSNSGAIVPDDADFAYYILPNFGVIAYFNTGYGGSVNLNVFNNSSTPQMSKL